jgi:hypothetical protein
VVFFDFLATTKALPFVGMTAFATADNSLRPLRGRQRTGFEGSAAQLGISAAVPLSGPRSPTTQSATNESSDQMRSTGEGSTVASTAMRS